MAESSDSLLFDMQEEPTAVPDSSAVRVALWRALHVEVDASPHVINDTIGLELVAPHAYGYSRSTHVADIPPELDAILMRALTKDPAGRFENARAMARPLDWNVGQVPA